MTKNRRTYFSDLTNKKLSIKPIEPILTYMQKIMKLKDVPSVVLRGGEYGPKITEELTRLNLSIVRGNKSWEGLKD